MAKTINGGVLDSASQGIGQWRKLDDPHVHHSRCDQPDYFKLDSKYIAKCMAGADSHLSYTCIYQNPTLVVFLYQFQGIDRIHTAYRSDIKPGDYVLSHFVEE